MRLIDYIRVLEFGGPGSGRHSGTVSVYRGMSQDDYKNFAKGVYNPTSGHKVVHGKPD